MWQRFKAWFSIKVEYFHKWAGKPDASRSPPDKTRMQMMNEVADILSNWPADKSMAVMPTHIASYVPPDTKQRRYFHVPEMPMLAKDEDKAWNAARDRAHYNGTIDNAPPTPVRRPGYAPALQPDPPTPQPQPRRKFT